VGFEMLQGFHSLVETNMFKKTQTELLNTFDFVSLDDILILVHYDAIVGLQHGDYEIESEESTYEDYQHVVDPYPRVESVHGGVQHPSPIILSNGPKGLHKSIEYVITRK
jgi:hypothetical protein